jgi:hypothetical protein
MTQNQQKMEEVQIAFTLWELLTQLDRLLWDRYFDQFNEIMAGLEEKRGMRSQFPF